MHTRREYLLFAVVALLALGGILTSNSAAVRWYVIVTLKPRELPARLIRPCFREITNRDLPRTIEDARALFLGGVDPAIFVKFRTDSEGIKFICDVFGKPWADIKAVDSGWIRGLTESGAHIFYIPFQWEEKTGIHLFAQDTIESGRMLEYLGPPGTGGYTVFLDDSKSTVYIHGFRL